MARANCNVAPGEPAFPTAGDTTYLTVVDRDGSMVSLIQSNFSGFGSGVVAEGTGFALQNRGGLFSLDPASPNALAGHKRSLHTIIPGFMTHDKDRIAFGIMGGFNQAQAHAQFVSNVVDFGMNIQAALEAARFTKQTFAGCDVLMEDRISSSVRDALAARGHQIELRGSFSSNVGGGQAVRRDSSTGVNYGASDPRKDGAAIPEPPSPKPAK
jgi:gamma-glutamyltranspeptidase/glutathione hydrolase